MIQVSWNPDASLSHVALDAGAVVQRAYERLGASFDTDDRPVASWLDGSFDCTRRCKIDRHDHNIDKSRSTCRRVDK